MMTSIATSKNRQRSSVRSRSLLVMEPPRHSHLPLVFLDFGKHLIGTSDTCTIRIAAEGVQPRHAMILVGEQKVLLKALDSKTWVNDGVVLETTLRPGDRISIGPITFAVRFATADELSDHYSEQAENDLAAAVVVAPTPEPQPTERRAPERHVPAPREVALPAAALVPELKDPDETALQDVQRQIQALTAETAIRQEVPPSAVSWQEKQQFAAREGQQKILAGELTRHSQRQREREVHLAKREAELEQKQSQLAIENERLVTTAQATRRELVEEHARQKALWQEWDAAYRRTADDLKAQLETIEQRRASIQIENDRLVADRAEVQRLQSEYEGERRVAAAERVQAAAELGELHAQRAAFETERRQLLADIQEREAQVANERRALAVAQDELLAARQEITHDQTRFATERSEESMRLEQQVREQTVAQMRLNEEASELQTLRLELESTRRSLEEQHAEFERHVEFDHDNEQSDISDAEIDELRCQLTDAQNELLLGRRVQHELQSQIENFERETRRKTEEFETWQRTLETQQAQLEVVREKLQLDREAISAAKAQVTPVVVSPQNDLPSEGGSKTSYSPPITVEELLGISTAEQPTDDFARLTESGLFDGLRPETDSLSSAFFASSTTELPPTGTGNYEFGASTAADELDSGFSNHHRDPGGFVPAPVIGLDRGPHSSPVSTVVAASRGGALSNEAETDVVFEQETAAVTVPMPEEVVTKSSLPSVDATLVDINRRFGFLTTPSTASPDGILPETETPNEVGTSAHESSGLSEATPANGPLPGKPVGGLSLPDLRAQLAQMFDLPEETQFECGSTFDSAVTEELQQSELPPEAVSTEESDQGLAQQSSSEVSSNVMSSFDSSEAGGSDVGDEFSLSAADSPLAVETSEVVCDRGTG